MIDQYLLRDLPRIIPFAKESKIISVREIIFGIIIVKHEDGSYTEYYPQYGYGYFKHYENIMQMYDNWIIDSFDDEARERQFCWRLEFLIRTKYCRGQDMFAKELGLTQSTISNYTFGKRIPDYFTILKMASIINDKPMDEIKIDITDIVSFLLSIYIDPYIKKEFDLYLKRN